MRAKGLGRVPTILSNLDKNCIEKQRPLDSEREDPAHGFKQAEAKKPVDEKDVCKDFRHLKNKCVCNKFDMVNFTNDLLKKKIQPKQTNAEDQHG